VASGAEVVAVDVDVDAAIVAELLPGEIAQILAGNQAPRGAVVSRRGRSCLCIRSRRTSEPALAPASSPLVPHVGAWSTRNDRLHGHQSYHCQIVPSTAHAASYVGRHP
jgi:hypothetical protein